MTVCLVLAYLLPLSAQTEPVDTIEELILPDTTIVIFDVLDKQASFPGGLDSLFRFLANAIVYPESAKEEMIEGIVFVQFVIERDGSISNVETVRSLHPVLDKVACDAIGELPPWSPGEKDGVTVRSLYIFPVNFRLDSAEKKKVRKKNRHKERK